jgi:hypothetical protein
MRYALVLPITSLAMVLAGCTEPPKPRSVAEFMENETALYGTLTRCENDPSAATDAECRNARQAAERIAAIEERALLKAREQAFESARAEYRQRLDRERDLRIKAEAEAEAARLERLIGPAITLPTDDDATPVEGEPIGEGDEPAGESAEPLGGGADSPPDDSD